MKKTKIRKIIALVLVALMLTAFAAGCSIIEYNEDRDLRQVVLSIKSFEMEYEVPFTVPYKVADREVKDAAGNTVYTSQRDAYGEPVRIPKVDNGSIVFFKDNDLTASDKTVYSTNKDGYFTSYTISGGKATGASVYRFINIESSGGAYTARWENIDTNEIATSAATNGAPVYAASHELPTVYFGDAVNFSDWYFITATPVYVTETWNTPEAAYTKTDLINYYNRSSSQFENQTNTLEERFDIVIQGLYTLEFMYLESENYIKSGAMEWGLTEKNLVKKSFYNSVDNAIKAQFESIFSDHGQEYSPDPSESDNSSKTYPVPDKTNGTEKDSEEWKPAAQYLGLGTSSDRTSLVRQAVKRWISSLEDIIDKDNTISDKERVEYLAELKELTTKSLDYATLDDIYFNLLSTEIDGLGNESYVYSVMWYLYGQTYDRNLKSSRLQEYIESTASISEGKVTKDYTDLLAEQKTVYGSSYDSFVSAVTGSSTLLYYPRLSSGQSSYFYVKHILLPFSAETSAKLTAFKESGNYTDEQYNKIRLDYAPLDNKTSYPVYEHVDGEDDLNTEKTVQMAYDEIYAKVTAAATPKEKAEAFEAMIFKYNTDPGIFNKETGYAVSAIPAKQGGPDESYVIEFATAARELRTAYLDGETGGKLGAISGPVLGDYGYHVLFLLDVPGSGKTVGLYDYLNISEQSKVYDILAANIKTEAYNSWSSRRGSFYAQNEGGKFYEVFKKRFKDLYEK